MKVDLFLNMRVIAYILKSINRKNLFFSIVYPIVSIPLKLYLNRKLKMYMRSAYMIIPLAL